MTSKIQICQRALSLLGLEQIQSLEAQNNKAQTCNLHYDMVKQDSLAQTTWNFATNKRELNQETDSPPSEYDYQYTLPPDLVAGPHKVFSDSNTKATNNSQWELANNKLMTDLQTVYIDYTANVSEERFPEYFTNFIVHALAAKLAKALTDQTTTAKFYDDKAYGTRVDNQTGGLLGRAMLLDSRNQSTRQITDNPIADVRHGS